MQLEVRPWLMEDAYELREICNATREWKAKMINLVYPDNFLRIAGRIRFYQNADPHRFAFRAIVVDGVVCGYIQCEKCDVQRAELSYCLDPAYRHQGIMKQAIMMLMKDVYQQLHVVTIFARVREANLASQRVLLRCGFSFEKIEDIYIFTKHR